MRSFAILATIYAATVGTTSALVDAGRRTTVDVDANGFDPRTNRSGCGPDGCEPEFTRDGRRKGKSRWSCQGNILDSSDEDDGCCITYYLGEPQDIVQVRIAFRQGDERTRTLDVFDNDEYHSTITSSGLTTKFEAFDLDTDETSELKLCVSDPAWNRDVWLSITEVKIMVD